MKKPDYKSVFGILYNSGIMTFSGVIFAIFLRWINSIFPLLPEILTADWITIIGFFLGIVGLNLFNYFVGVRIISPID